MSLHALPLLLLGCFSGDAHGADRSHGPRVVPGIELGRLWYPGGTAPASLVVDGSLDYRFRKRRTPFLRLSVDTTRGAVRTHHPDQPSSAVTSIGRIVDTTIGGGVRFGPPRVKVVYSGQLGLQVAHLPHVLWRTGAIMPVSIARAGLVGIVGLGLEVQVMPALELTAEVSARASRLYRTVRSPGLAGSTTVGFRTSL